MLAMVSDRVSYVILIAGTVLLIAGLAAYIAVDQLPVRHQSQTSQPDALPLPLQAAP